MNTLNIFISVIYYTLVGYIALLLIYNLIKSKNWKEEILYIVILIPFILRLFRLK
jgi:hypothetical protein